MKKKLLALLLSAAMATSLLAGCGNNGTQESSAPPADSGAPTESTPASGNENVLRLGVLGNQTGWFAVYDYNNAL